VSTPEFIHVRGDAVLIAVKLQPRASCDTIVGAAGGELRIKVKAPPVDSAANQALIDLVADTLGCSRRCVSLIRGEKSRHKLLAVTELPLARVVERLSPAAPSPG
jgi:uncharacterized protein (TIGR00251 family)